LRGLSELADLTVLAPVPLIDYANPESRVLASLEIPKSRIDGAVRVLHPRWLYPPFGGWVNAFFLYFRLVLSSSVPHRRGAIDLIDAHFAHPEGIAAALLASTLGIPFMITMRGCELRYQHHRAKRFWMSWALKRANRIITVSDGLMELAIRLGADPLKIRTIPNGINREVFYRRDRSECRRIHQIPEDARVILSAGDLARIKGHHRIIEALRTIGDDGCPAYLLIAGGVGRSGKYVDTLRARVAELGLQDRVRFTGLASQSTLAELMCAADVFCLASSSEGWPNVVNEALACGTPVVATDVGAVRRMLPSNRYGIVVPVDDVSALATALREALARDWNNSEIFDWGQSRSWEQVAVEVMEEAQLAVVGA